MSKWQVLVLRWGGILLAGVFAVALILVNYVIEIPEGETSSSAPQVVYWVLLAIGVVGAVAGFVVKPKEGVHDLVRKSIKSPPES